MKLSTLFVSLAFFVATALSQGILLPKPGASVPAGGSFALSFEHSIVIAIYYFGNLDVSLVPIAASSANATSIPLVSYPPSAAYPQIIRLPKTVKPGPYLLVATEYIYPLNGSTVKRAATPFNQTFFVQ